MSDCGSDSTDILLLIPPDFFSTENYDINNKSFDESTTLTSICNPLRNRCKMSDWPHNNEISINFPHNSSTPLKTKSDQRPDFKIISEIDEFLCSNDKHNNINDTTSLSLRKFDPTNCFTTNSSNPIASATKSNLIKLTDLWSNNKFENENLQEEKLRRQHLEKAVQALQGNLSEYQQKIAVALKIDNDKNEAIEEMAIEKARFINTLHKYEQQILLLQQQLHLETTSNQNGLLQSKLAEALAIIEEVQEKNQYLEQKMESNIMSSSEIKEIHKTQIKDLETRLSNSRENEKLLNDAVADLTRKLNDTLAKFEREKSSSANSLRNLQQVNSELAKANDEKKTVQTKFMNEKTLKHKLEKQIEHLKELSEKLNEKESQLLTQLESQKFSLKTFYQNQLEKAIAEKVKEFQNQMNQVEELLRSDAKLRERLVAERAIRQIELINQKHEEEVILMNEKQKSEISLYRMQLYNSTKTISQLQEKLNAYQKQRTDIADRLHQIMEVQWQRTCEILTSPTVDEKLHSFKKAHINSIDRRKTEENCFVENENFQTPKTSRAFNVEPKHNEDDADKQKREMIEAYIELLLQKSPKDLEQLEEILNSHRKANGSKNLLSKPPWK